MTSQEKHTNELEKITVTIQNGLRTKNGNIWIPEQDSELQLKVLVIGHGGPGGHRAWKATVSILKETYYWENMALDCEEFVRKYIQCLAGPIGPAFPDQLL